MTFRFYLFLMTAATIACWIAVAGALAFINPLESNLASILLLYGSLALALVGTFALVGIVVRKWLFREEPHFVQVAVAFRQGIFFAALVVVLLALSHAELLRWWLIPLLVVFFTIVEYLILSVRDRRRSVAPT